MSIVDRLIVTILPFVPKPIVRRFSKRYVAGDSLDAAIRAVKELNTLGACATMDVLGEDVEDQKQASAAADEYLKVLEAIEREKLDSNVSVKLTHMGLKLDLDFCERNVARIVEEAKKRGNFVRIDMEDSSVTSKTLEIFRRLRERHENVGIVVQSYLRRTLADVVALRDLRPSYRVCKGIYQEPREIAFKDREIIIRNFALIVDDLFRNGSYVGIATHDEKVVFEALRLIHEHGLEKNQYEFQMLLGVDHQLRDILIREGHKVRIYVPFGESWYAYSMRRLKENPTIAWYVLRNLFKG
jgi:proline dehydrogenase